MIQDMLKANLKLDVMVVTLNENFNYINTSEALFFGSVCVGLLFLIWQDINFRILAH